MQRSPSPPPRRPGQRTNWTLWEIAGIVLSLLMIVPSLLIQGYALIKPRTIPAQVNNPNAIGNVEPRPLMQTAYPTPENTATVGTTPGTQTATSTIDPYPTTSGPTSTTAPSNTAAPTVPTALVTTTSPPRATECPVNNPCPTRTTGATVTPGGATATNTVATPTNTATIDPYASPTNTSQATATATRTNTAGAGTLSFEKRAVRTTGQDTTEVGAGETFSYILTVTNSGGSPVQATVSDDAPATLQLVDASADGGTCTIAGQTVTCAVTVPANRTVIVIINAVVRSDVAIGTGISNSARVQVAGQPDVNSNTAVVTVVRANPTALPTVTPVPPTGVPATAIPPTQIQPTQIQPTQVQPSAVPFRTATRTPRPPQPTSRVSPEPTSPGLPVTPPPRATATNVPPTNVPPTNVPPTSVPPSATRVGATTTALPAATRTNTPVRPAATRTTAPVRTATPRRTTIGVPQPLPQPTRRPTVTVVRTIASGPSATPRPTLTLGPTLPPVTTPIGGAVNPAVRFNLQSDSGQVFPGDTVIYTVTLQHAGTGTGGSSSFLPEGGKSGQQALQTSPPITNVVVLDELSSELEVLSARGAGLTVNRTGQRIEGRRPVLAAGETVRLVITVRVKTATTATQIQNQASLLYAGLNQSVFSNIVPLTIVQQAATATPTGATATTTAILSATAVISPTGGPSATATLSPTAGPSPTATVTVTATVDNATSGVPSATPQPTAAGGTPPTGDSLPATSGGIPLAGVMLLGLTLLVHSVRVRRNRIRI